MDDQISEKIEKFFSAYRPRTYAKGQVLMLAGEITDAVYQLVEGRVKVYDVTYRGDEVILNTFKPPAFFPMSIAINKNNNPYVYEAETEVTLRQAPADAVVAFIKDNPDVMFDLLRRLYIGVDGLLKRMSLLMGSSARSRLIYEILLEARRFGVVGSDGSCNLDVTEKSIGSRAGLSRETVSREMHKLKQDGQITMTTGTIHITDLPELEKMLGQEI